MTDEDVSRSDAVHLNVEITCVVSSTDLEVNSLGSLDEDPGPKTARFAAWRTMNKFCLRARAQRLVDEWRSSSGSHVERLNVALVNGPPGQRGPVAEQKLRQIVDGVLLKSCFLFKNTR